MATWGCADCTTVYSVGAPRCPHCGSTNRTGDDMPKITRHGGASIASEHGPEVVDPPRADPPAEPEPKPTPKRRAARKRAETAEKD